MSLKQRSFIIILLSVLFFISMIFVNVFEYQKQRADSHFIPVINEKSKACIDCHTEKGISIGAIDTWRMSKHAMNGVGCANCHGDDEDTVHAIKGVVLPSKCAGCHKDQYNQFKDSKHANAWLKMQKSPMYKATPANMRATMCQSCHNVGWLRSNSIVAPKKDVAESGKEEASDDDFFGDSDEAKPEIEEILDPKSPDVSIGKCDLCHTRHRFNVQEAKSPQACLNCHMGHNSVMGTGGNYLSSKHGIIHDLEEGGSKAEPVCMNCHAGHKGYYSLKGAKGRAPTCASCHMSGKHDVSSGITVGGVGTGGILEGEAKLPFKVYEVKQETFDKERISMVMRCQDCHSSKFGNRMLEQADNVKKECDKILGEAVNIVKGLDKARLIKASNVGAYNQPWEFNTQAFRTDMSQAEILLIDIYTAYASTWKSAYHMNDQNNQMQGWSTLNAKLTQLKAENKRLRGQK